MAAVKFFESEQLRVFSDLPSDEIVTKVAESFVPAAPAPRVPESKDAWTTERDALLKTLREKSFAGWPMEGCCPVEVSGPPAFSAEKEGVRFAAWDFESQHDVRLRLYLAHRAGLKPEELDLVVVNALDAEGWTKFLAAYQGVFAAQLAGETLPAADAAEWDSTKKMFAAQKWSMAYVAPRGIGPTAWDQTPKKQTQHRRRFQLLGQTLDGMRVWDVRRPCRRCG